MARSPDVQSRLRQLSQPRSTSAESAGEAAPTPARALRDDWPRWADDVSDIDDDDVGDQSRKPLSPRNLRSPRQRLPHKDDDGVVDRLRAAVTFGRLHFVVMAIAAVIATAATAWYVMGTGGGDLTEALGAPAKVDGDPPQAAQRPGPSPSQSVQPSPGPATTGAPTAQAQTMLIHVVGAVRKPSVVTLTSGARVTDAITAAGGLGPHAAPGELNLAQPLHDGQQVVIGTKSRPGGEVRTPGASAPGPTGSASDTASSPGSAINLNTATVGDLDALPGVGPVTAQRIIDWRDRHGPFSSVGQLEEVEGIGVKTMERLGPLVTV